MSNWISVSDRMPESGQLVLVTDGREMAVYEYRPDNRYGFVWDEQGVWGHDCEPSIEPTHWQPTPEMP